MLMISGCRSQCSFFVVFAWSGKMQFSYIIGSFTSGYSNIKVNSGGFVALDATAQTGGTVTIRPNGGAWEILVAGVNGGAATTLLDSSNATLGTTTHGIGVAWTGEEGSFNVTGGDLGDMLIGGGTPPGSNGWTDTMIGGLGVDTLYGAYGDDLLYGNESGDRLAGNDGADTLYGNDGFDTLYGNNGNDLIYGGDGTDSIYGNNGDDTIYAGEGNDTINGANDNDYIEGGTGNDNIRGNDGADTIYGNDGADTIFGNNGSDFLIGGAGADSLLGGADADTLTGGNDADQFYWTGGTTVTAATDAAGDTITDFSTDDSIVIFGDYSALHNTAAGNISIGGGTLTLTSVTGNFSATYSANYTTITLTTAVSAPTGMAMATASDSGSSSSDRITNVATPTITGTVAEAGTIVLYDSDGTTSLGATTVASAGSWSITASTLTGGAHNLTAKLTNGGGASSPASGALAVTIDTTAPSAPTITAISDDTGSSSTDGVTTDTTLMLTGTAEANAVVTLSRGGTSIGTTSANGSGAWTFDYTGTTLTGGAYSFTATATDTAGNASSASSAFAVTIDTGTTTTTTETTTTVTTPTVTVTETAPSISVSSAGRDDTTTGSPTARITGSATVGARIEVFNDANNNGRVDDGEGAVIASGVAGADGSYTLLVPLTTGAITDLVLVAVSAGGLRSSPADIATRFRVVAIETGTEVVTGATTTTTPGTNITTESLITSDGTEIVDVEATPDGGTSTSVQLTDQTEADGQAFLTASLPSGTKLTVSGPTTQQTPTQTTSTLMTTLQSLQAEGDDSSSLTAGAETLTSRFESTVPVMMRQVTLTATTSTGGGSSDAPIIINGTDDDADGVEVLVVDARSLSSSNVVNLNNIEVSFVYGSVNVGGGMGDNAVYGDSNNQHMVMGPGDDTLSGGGGNDTVMSTTGNDLLFGDDGEDMVNGGDDQDTVMGGAGEDVVGGGAGHDLVYGDGGEDTLFGENGSDTLLGGTGHDVLLGGSDSDTLLGMDGRDILFGEDGDDLLVSGVENDTLVGGVGDDRLFGEDGDDLLAGDDGGDWLIGGTSNDTLLGGAGGDRLFGDDGADLLAGDDGDDWLIGGASSDTLLGGTGNDVLFGEDGEDALFAVGGGSDTLVGGAGADLFVIGQSGGGGAMHWVADFAVGQDRLAFAGSESLEAILASASREATGVRLTLADNTQVILADVNTSPSSTWFLGVSPNG
jgi:large repetitive protein